jgi:two-component system sensor histidine kinase MprB
VTRRIAITGVLAVCLTALVVGVIAYVLVSHNDRTYEDRVLVNDARHPANTFGPKFTYSELAQLSNVRTGAVVRQTAALAALGQLPALSHGYANVALHNRQLRVYTVRVRRRLALSVAVSDAPVRASLARLRRGVLIAIVAGALLASLILIWITRRALAPVRDTAAVADRIVSTGDLTARVPASSGDDEIARLATSINRMLDHLEASDAALRRLVADASHELRSPVTTLRGNLELLTEGTLDPADRAEALADTRAEAERLGGLVEELLTLARADTVTPEAPIEILALIEAALEGTSAVFIPPPGDVGRARVQGDPISLRAMVRNLVENAERYGGAAEVSVEADTGWLTLKVIDRGPGVPVPEREAIFGRFSRGTHSTGLPGSGLGLAIVAATARSHGGSVSVADTPGGGATFVVALPRARSAHRAGETTSRPR